MGFFMRSPFPKITHQQQSTYRVVAEELAVAAVTVFSVLLIGGGGGTGTPLRAAVFILALLQLTRGMAQRPIRQFVPFTRLVPEHTKQTET